MNIRICARSPPRTWRVVPGRRAQQRRLQQCDKRNDTTVAVQTNVYNKCLQKHSRTAPRQPRRAAPRPVSPPFPPAIAVAPAPPMRRAPSPPKPPPPRKPPFFQRRRLPSRPRPRPLHLLLLLLLLLPWLFVTLDPFPLHWLRWTLTLGPRPAPPALFQSCPPRNYALPLAVVVPLIAEQTPRLQWSLARWGLPRFAPCLHPSRNASLVFFFDRPLAHPATAAALATLRAAVRTGPAARAVHRCFADVTYLSAGLSREQTTNTYALDLLRNIVQTRGSNNQWEAAFRELGGGRFRHMLYMEPDTWPIRPGWLAKVLEESAWGPFWMRGTTMRYAPKFNIGLEPFRTRYQRHLNGNAIYALDDPCFETYRSLTRQAYGDGAFDVAMAQFRLGLGQIMTFQQVAHRFQATELVVDIGVTEVHEDDLLRRFPRTYLVHGKWMHVKHPAINFMQYR